MSDNSLRKKYPLSLFIDRIWCWKHLYSGPLSCCPWPGCPRGTVTDSIIGVISLFDSELMFERTQWTTLNRTVRFGWQSATLPAWFSVVERTDEEIRLILKLNAVPPMSLFIITPIWGDFVELLNQRASG
jgi:hypothetical protein